MKKLILSSVVLVFAITLMSFASATFTLYNSSINTNYPVGQNLTGYVKISFENHPINSLFQDNLGNSVSLRDVLNNSDYNYSCSVRDCANTYDLTNKAQQKTFSMTANETKYIGLYLQGQINSIKSISFNVSSDAGQAGQSQLLIDLLDNGNYDVINNHAGTQVGPKSSSCYNPTNQNLLNVGLDNTPYCMAINLTQAPKYELGAWIKKISSGNDRITMTLYDSSGQTIDSCDLNTSKMTSGGSETTCTVNSSIASPSQYYVCVTQKSGTGKYQTLVYQAKDSSLNCGFHSNPIGDKIASYNIFAKPLMFGPFGNVFVNNTLPSKNKFSYMAENYLINNYGGSMNCSNGCIIPIKLNSTVSQQVTLSNLNLDYSNSIGSIQDNSFYNAAKTSALVDSNSQILPLSGFFYLGNNTGDFSYQLLLSGKNLITKQLTLTNFSVELKPTKMIADFPQNFTALVYSTWPVYKYFWDFGDGTNETTTMNNVTHVYNETKNYTMEITFYGENSNYITKDFKITGESPKRVVESSIGDLSGYLSVFKADLSALPPTEKQIVNSVYNVDNLTKELSDLQAQKNSISSDADYPALASKILSLKFPKSVSSQLTQNNKPFFSNQDVFNTDALTSITKEATNYSSKQISDAALYWDQSNLSMKLSETKITIPTTQNQDEINLYTLNIIPKQSSSEYYIIFKNTNGLKIYNSQTINSSDYLAIKATGTKEIQFSMTNLQTGNLPVFVSPKISSLSMQDLSVKPAPKPLNKPLILGLIFFGLILVGILIYLVLQRWYRVKYENYLFSDRNNLYNAMVFVNSEKKNGKSDNEIEKDLRNAGWSSEQVRYILRKYSGKRTGMYSFKKYSPYQSVPRPNSQNNQNQNYSNKYTNFNK